ncbi:MAG: outer membrane beta-barrel protein [Candidatus Brevundimonas colombiensis]|uniref:Outer membrane beta-barrel protein n=1 Tax=Candidatus Brevundimonas colombiensis TaxID=3121376 RepID=A0AAJ5X498_9CAUL|nr:outer membrane beta-barrel protein [Brevundimonas sp.]WEK40050.1 MAG: outer membrane beta-barrel protein [Brevundimonas sp.]
MRRAVHPAVVASLGLFAADQAAAQTTLADPFFRQRGQAVRDRPQPAYDAAGFRAGGFTLWPRLLSAVVFDDNVFAAEDNARAATTLRLTPEVTARSDWGRHQIQAHARLDLGRNLNVPREDTTDWRLGGSGRLDAARDAHLALSLDMQHGREARTAIGSDPLTVRPVAFDGASARLSGQRTRGRLRLDASADLQRRDYRDGADAAGAPVEQDDRDRTILTLSGRAAYALSPATAVFVQIAGDDRDYRRVPGRPDRTSTGREALAGVDFELGGLMRGDIAVGHLRQTFDDPAFGDLDGFGGRGRLTWFPTALTTVSVAAARAVADTGAVGAAGALRTDLTLGVDHELLRNLIVSARAGHIEDAYVGRDRTDRRISAGLAADWRLNRRYGLNADIDWIDQSSEGTARGPRYRALRLTLATVARF